MKKLIALMAAFVLALALASCSLSVNKNNNQSDDKTSEQTSSEQASSEQASSEQASSEQASSEQASSEQTSSEALAPNEYVFHGIRLTLPDGFAPVPDSSPIIIVPADYPATSDNITLVFTPGAADINAYTKETLEQSFAQELAAAGMTAEFKNYEKTTVAGKDAVLYEHTVAMAAISMDQSIYTIFTDDGVISITFTNAGGGYADAFRQVVSTAETVD